jgi:putative mRNA 3-end processing factor
VSSAQVVRDGTVLLGDHVSCDGFQWGRGVRVQTHVHDDHMHGFRRSKGVQDIAASEATRDLLIAVLNQDLPYRNNLIGLRSGDLYTVGGETIELADSGHMLGSVQVRVTDALGFRMGYSSDFFWPLERVLEVDELIVNSPYGGPEHTRGYLQQEVEQEFVELVHGLLRRRPVLVLGYRGRLQYAMSLLVGHVYAPILASRRVAATTGVYEKHGTHIHAIAIDSEEGRALLEQGHGYLAFAELTEQRQYPWIDGAAKVSLSAYMVPHDEPILAYTNGDFRVALTDHADFAGTMEFVRASGAKRVLVHPLSGTPDVLASEIRGRLGVAAAVAVPLDISEWS